MPAIHAPKPLLSHRVPSLALRRLPTIPKSPVSHQHHGLVLLPTEDIYLASTPFTLTQPGFGHGPTRLPINDLPIAKLAAAVDDTFDWTAFQMALLGGAGDTSNEPADYSQSSEADLDGVEDLSTWFEELGFDGAGRLIKPPRTAGRMKILIIGASSGGHHPCRPVQHSTTRRGFGKQYARHVSSWYHHHHHRHSAVHI